MGEKLLKIVVGIFLIVVLIFVGSRMIGEVIKNMEDDVKVKFETNYGAGSTFRLTL